MIAITNPKIKMINNSVGRCPECKKFFGIKKLDERAITLVNKHGVCPSCLDRLNLNVEEEETKMENTEMKATEAVVEMNTEQDANRIKRLRLETITVPEEGDPRLVIPGPRGVTKHQMIAAITRNADNPDNIRSLAEDYPATFRGSLRYVKKDVRDKVREVIGEDDIVDQEKFNLLQKLNPGRKGITYHQVIIAVENASEDHNLAFISQIAKYFPEQFRGSMRYIAKKYHSTIEKALEMSNMNLSVKQLAARA